jgi:hypothetical protein
MRRGFAFLVLCLAVIKVGAADEPNYFPSKVGMKWTYRISGGPDLVYLLAAKEEKLGDQVCTRMDLKIDLISALTDNVGIITSGAFIPIGKSRFVTVSTEHVASLKDGVYRFMIDGNLIGPPVNFLQTPIKKRDSWKNEFRIKDKKGKVTFTADFDDVEVPAGKFKDALLITGETIENGVITKMQNWYVADVGMVKQLILNGKEETLLELTRLEIVKLDDKK